MPIITDNFRYCGVLGGALRVTYTMLGSGPWDIVEPPSVVGVGTSDTPPSGKKAGGSLAIGGLLGVWQAGAGGTGIIGPQSAPN